MANGGRHETAIRQAISECVSDAITWALTATSDRCRFSRGTVDPGHGVSTTLLVVFQPNCLFRCTYIYRASESRYDIRCIPVDYIGHSKQKKSVTILRKTTQIWSYELKRTTMCVEANLRVYGEYRTWRQIFCAV